MLDDLEDERDTKRDIDEIMSRLKYLNEDEEDIDSPVNTEDDEFLDNISNTLKSQVQDELGIGYDPIEDSELEENEGEGNNRVKKIFKIVGITVGVLLLLVLFLVGTKPGRNIISNITAWYIQQKISPGNEDEQGNIIDLTPTINPDDDVLPEITPGIGKEPRSEEHVINCLLFGIEEFDGARNTDSMMLASINTKTNKITLISMLRDTYAEFNGYKPGKLNSFYARKSSRTEGADLLMRVIENIYNVKIDAYASVNFGSFEDIVNLIGGITIELGKSEAEYLRTTNYISNPMYRNVYAGMQSLNGNQTVGYCRVRKVVTLGGYNDDVGRTVRQRRVMDAIFEKCKTKSIFELITLGDKCLEYVISDLAHEQIVSMVNLVLEKGIPELQSIKLPADGMFEENGRTGFNGITYAVMPDKEANTKLLYQLLYGDTEEEAQENYNKHIEAIEAYNSITDELN